MKKITLIATVLFNFIIVAQPVLNASDINPLNIIGNNFSATSTTLGVGSAGANQTWDFSSLVLTAQGSSNTNSVLTAPFASSFPAANFFISNGSSNDSFSYYRLTSNILESNGASSDSQIIINYSNPETIFVFPFTFNTIVNDTFQQNNSSLIESETINYNAYGTVITAFGTYTNVIRLKRTSGGSVNYTWFKVNPYIPVLSANIYTGGTTSYSVFQNTNLATTQNEVKQFSIYPNPTSGNISIKNIDFSNKSMFVKVYNMLGNQIVNNYKLETESANIDLSNYASGLYFIEIADENNKVIYQDKVIKK